MPKGFAVSDPNWSSNHKVSAVTPINAACAIFIVLDFRCPTKKRKSIIRQRRTTMPPTLQALVCLWALTFSLVAGEDYLERIDVYTNANGCSQRIRRFNPLIHKPKYTLGVYSSEGDAEVFRLYNTTFAQYLTLAAGQRFDPPIQFDVVPVTLTKLMDLEETEEADFGFSSSAVFSCMASERKAEALTTIVNKREARGHIHELDMYGGVIFTRADNDRVNSIEDLKGKTIGAGGITAMGAGQTQFYEMFRDGLSYVADPLQVSFTNNEGLLVGGVLKGDFEVGFARTDQIERHTDEKGEPVDPGLFKVINPQVHILDNGQLFPFLSSTGLHPEWPVFALNHVSRDVSDEVQEALMALRDHAASLRMNKTIRCDTTPELAELAEAARTSGAYFGWRTARSYFEVRTKQEAAGLLRKKSNGDLHCIRGDTLYDDIYCPEGQYKLTKEEFDMSCKRVGLECIEGYSCYCQPCIKAHEVSVFQSSIDRTASNASDTEDGCEKMSLCGIIEQTKTLHIEIVDNRKRENPVVDADMHVDTRTHRMVVEPHPTKPYVYVLEWTQSETGIGIMNILFDGEQIPQSPVRIQVVDRQCDLDYPGQQREATSTGTCECGDGYMEIGGKCIESTIMAIAISIAAAILVSMIGVCFVRWRNKKNDEIWQINVDELMLDDPVEVIGQGSFGVVLLGTYRGTKVALKRAIKLGSKGSKHSVSRRSRGGSRGSGRGNRSADRNTDSVGLSSTNSGASNRESDPEAGGESDSENLSYDESNQTGSTPGRESRNASRSRGSKGPNSLGFLAEDFGRPTQWGWLFPWAKKNTFDNRFKEAILGSSNVSAGKSWHAALCPWFNAQVRAEAEFIQEMRILSRLRHPSITTVLGAVTSHNHDPMLVMEYMEYGSLHDLLRNETMHLSGEIILQVCRDVAQGLRFLHSSKPPILHGDMKSRNILIDSRFRAKLCDFGLSAKKTNKITGTPYFLAPEYLRGQTDYTTMCDIFSIGIIMYEIYARQDPYQGEDFRDTLRKVCDRRVNKRPGVPESCPAKIADTMKKCWSPDPFFRPSAKDLDTLFLDMNSRDAEPLTTEEQLQARARKERSTEDMLYELFPRHVADQLKAGKKVEPENHEEVTVVFSDIDISKALSPLKVSNMLDRLYLAFDKVAKANNVFKVETIGDAYMGVTNLEKSQENSHVKDAVLFAIALVNEANQILIDEAEPQKGYVNIRVGVHCGAVVSNVIGSLNPRYGLFGDTVNTASRMESNSKANRILCSEVAFQLLAEQAPEISARRRGRIAVKGKGEMTVFWVGDLEIQSTDDKGKSLDVISAEEEKRKRAVEFDEENEDLAADETGDQEEEEPTEKELWRPARQSKHVESAMSKGKSKKVAREEAPPRSTPKKKTTTASQKPVKEAIRMKRSKT